jgi:uridine kinase
MGPTAETSPEASAPAVIAPAIIAIDGVDGSGKSTLAQGLVLGLGRAGWPAVLLSVDDFRRPVDWARADRSEAEAYYQDYYELALLETCLRAFRDGAPQVTIPVFDARTEQLDGTRDVALAGAAVAVVEGVFALRVPAAAAGLVIHIEVAPAEARRRLIERDLGRGRPRAVIEHRLAARYEPAHERYLAAHDPGRRADVIVDSNRPHAPRTTRRELGRVPAGLAAALSPLLPPPGDPFSP